MNYIIQLAEEVKVFLYLYHLYLSTQYPSHFHTSVDIREVGLDNLIIIGSHHGSGKTRRLTDIYTELVYSGVNHNEIAAVAFNRSVGYTMRARISANTGIPQSELCSATTLHALCLRLLREDIETHAMDPLETAREYIKYFEDAKNYKEKYTLQKYFSKTKTWVFYSATLSLTEKNE